MLHTKPDSTSLFKPYSFIMPLAKLRSTFLPVLLDELFPIVIYLFLFQYLLKNSIAGYFIIVKNLIRYDPFDTFRRQMVEYLPVLVSIQMLVFEALDRILCHIRPFSLQRQLFKESWILLFYNVHLLFNFIIESLVGLMLNNKALKSTSRVSFGCLSLLLQ